GAVISRERRFKSGQVARNRCLLCTDQQRQQSAESARAPQKTLERFHRRRPIRVPIRKNVAGPASPRNEIFRPSTGRPGAASVKTSSRHGTSFALVSGSPIFDIILTVSSAPSTCTAYAAPTFS